MARCRRIVPLALLLGAVAAPPAAARIAFVSERGGEPEIYVMADDGTGETNLSKDAAQPDFAPAWSPDGTRIAYQRGYGPDGDIWVMGADGSNQKPLVADDGAETAPSWSPDGRRVAYISDSSGNDHLYVVDVGGGAPQLLDTANTDPSDPAFSPDGKRIAYWDADGQLIHVVGADGTGDHAVGGPDAQAIGGDQTPSWTPDGAGLVFTSLRETARSYDIWTMGLDGGGQRALTSSADREIDPAVSSDGHIAYASDAPGDYDVYSMRADGTGATRLTTAEGDDTAPAWSPGAAPAAQPVSSQSTPSAATPTATTAPSRGTPTAKRTALRVRTSYLRTHILVYRRKLVVRVPYRLNRAATVTVHLYLHGKLVGFFKDRGVPGLNVAKWQHRIAVPARWRGRYTVAIVRASEPRVTG